MLCHHLLIDTEGMFHSSIYMGINRCFPHKAFDFTDQLLNAFFALTEFGISQFFDLVIFIWFKITQGKIVQFNFYFGDTEPVSKRCVDIHGLP